MIGRLHNVERVLAGSVLVRDHVAGETSLDVRDGVDFAEGGGVAMIGDSRVSYTGVVPAEEFDTLTLASALAVDLDEGDRIDVHPQAPTLVAYVDLGGDDYERAVVHQALTTVQPGIRGDLEAAETVEVIQDGAGFVVVNVIARPQKIVVEEGTGRQEIDPVDGTQYLVPGPMEDDENGDLVDTEPVAVGRFGSRYPVVSGGEVVGDLTAEGLLAQDADVQGTLRAEGDVYVQGEPLSDQHSGLVVAGRQLVGTATENYWNERQFFTDDTGWLDGMPRGLVRLFEDVMGADQVGSLNLGWHARCIGAGARTIEDGRAYLVSVWWPSMVEATGNASTRWGQCWLRCSEADGGDVAPSGSPGTTIDKLNIPLGWQDGYDRPYASAVLVGGTDLPVGWITFAQVIRSSSECQIDIHPSDDQRGHGIAITDIGPVTATGMTSRGDSMYGPVPSGQTQPSDDSTPVSETEATTRQTWQRDASWWQVWSQFGERGSQYHDGFMLAGGGSGGITSRYRSQFGVPDWSTYVNSGVVLEKAILYLKVHSSTASKPQVVITAHGAFEDPAGEPNVLRSTTVTLRRGSTVAVELPSTWLGDIKNRVIKGFGVGDSGGGTWCQIGSPSNGKIPEVKLVYRS